MHNNDKQKEIISLANAVVGMATYKGPISTGGSGLGPIRVLGLTYLVYKCQRGSIAATSSAMMKTHRCCHKMPTWPWISASVRQGE